MNKHTESLQLADVVDVFDAHSERLPLEIYSDISSELRRLHEVNQELLEALTDCVEHMHWTQPQGETALKKAKAVIAKATGCDA